MTGGIGIFISEERCKRLELFSSWYPRYLFTRRQNHAVKLLWKISETGKRKHICQVLWTYGTHCH